MLIPSNIPILLQLVFQSYREYHADIYPETNGLESAMGPADWWAGSDTPVPKINLDPKKRPKVDLLVFQDKLLSERPLNKKVTKSADSSNGHSNGFSSNGKASSVNKEADNVRI